MENILLAIHLLTALAIIGLVLLQQGKGAEAGASFGAGASQTFFGSSGSWNFFSKMTAVLATVFFLTSIGLAVVAKHHAGVDEDYLPTVEEERSREPRDGEIPAAPERSGGSEIPVPEGQ
jgi:preprotein translocase subunit SecG